MHLMNGKETLAMNSVSEIMVKLNKDEWLPKLQ